MQVARIAPDWPVPSLMHRRRALKQLITYIGLDVHKETIAVALAEAGKRNEVREYGKIANTPASVKTLVAKLARNGHELRFCYEAGPCGYGIQRQLDSVEARLHRGRSLADSPQTWRADQDRSARCDQPRQAASGW